MTKTLFDKIWDKHIVKELPDGLSAFYIDTHLIHEVTSPQAFMGLRKRGLKVLRPKQTIATTDHNVPTFNQHLPIQEALSKKQVDTLIQNCADFGIELYDLKHAYQGIVHVIGPELGITQPGLSMVCGDSHTSTHGAFGCIAFGIGTTEVEMVFATQCLLQSKPKQMRINLEGNLPEGVVSKDVVLYILSQLSTSGATGYFIEYAGSAIESMSMEARMTICNMSIEMGARGGLIAPDEKTYQYMKNRPFAPKEDEWDAKMKEWKTLFSDKGVVFDKEYTFDVSALSPMITYGTNPAAGIQIGSFVPETESIGNPDEKQIHQKALAYMGIEEGKSLLGMPVDYVFIGSCTNSRIEDLRMAASIVKGKQKAANVQVWIVPGSKQVEKQAQEEGLDVIFREAGFEFRQAGCSACLGMNEDKIPSGKYCVSTSNRNFEGRQGAGARTMLASPLTAAIVAITGKITDVRDFLTKNKAENLEVLV